MARRKFKKWRLPSWLKLVAVAAVIGLAIHLNREADRLMGDGQKVGEFDVLYGAKLIDHGTNDGDSFHMEYSGEEYIFRLYYVDCPEKTSHRYKTRLAEQGEYFGGLPELEVVKLGLEAKDYVEHLLEEKEFVIYTRWEKVFNSGRFFAFVEIEGRLLSEILVEQGLARIYTGGVNLPDGKKFSEQRDELRDIERRAKAARVGGWRAR